MNIKIRVDENVEDMEISIACKSVTPEVEKLVATIRMMDQKLPAVKDTEVCLLDISQIIYIETVERKCFVYTSEEVYESDFKLYELESRLDQYGFFRASKSFLIQLKHIQSIKADINRKLRLTMSNGEQIIASRQYAEELKKRLGMER